MWFEEFSTSKCYVIPAPFLECNLIVWSRAEIDPRNLGGGSKDTNFGFNAFVFLYPVVGTLHMSGPNVPCLERSFPVFRCS